MRVPATTLALPNVRVPRPLIAARVIHPFPTALNVAATLALSWIASDGIPAAGVLARLGGAMFCAQAAIGALNDYCDRDIDSETKPWKPVARGAIEPGAALAVAAAMTVAAGALALMFGLLAIAVAAVGLAAGFVYDLRLKRTPLSALPFALALPALPFWVWVSLDAFEAELWWLLLVAPFAALAVHLSNALTDFEDDARTGVRGLAQALGAPRARSVWWASSGFALALAFVLGLVLDYDWAVFLAGALPAAALFMSSIVAYALRPGPAALQLGFGLTGIATACLAAGWLAAAVG